MEGYYAMIMDKIKEVKLKNFIIIFLESFIWACILNFVFGNFIFSYIVAIVMELFCYLNNKKSIIAFYTHLIKEVF